MGLCKGCMAQLKPFKCDGNAGDAKDLSVSLGFHSMGSGSNILNNIWVNID